MLVWMLVNSSWTSLVIILVSRSVFRSCRVCPPVFAIGSTRVTVASLLPNDFETLLSSTFSSSTSFLSENIPRLCIPEAVPSLSVVRLYSSVARTSVNWTTLKRLSPRFTCLIVTRTSVCLFEALFARLCRLEYWLEEFARLLGRDSITEESLSPPLCIFSEAESLPEFGSDSTARLFTSKGLLKLRSAHGEWNDKPLPARSGVAANFRFFSAESCELLRRFFPLASRNSS